MQVAICSNVCGAVMEGLRSADFQESRFQSWKHSYMASAVLIMWSI